MTAAPSVIGVVGLGTMGGRMAARLLGAGYTVVGTNRTPERGLPLVDRGLVWRDTPREVAAGADVVLSSVADDGALEAVFDGDSGILAGLRPGTTYVDASTVSPQLSRALAERVRGAGAEMLDAPVSGSVPQVEAGELTIMVGGSEDAFDHVEPILRHLGSATHVGSNGQGLLLKLAVNISLAEQIVAFGEGVLLAERGGIDRNVAVDFMMTTAIASPMLRARAPLVLDPPPRAWFDIGMMQKDLALALDAGSQLHAAMPGTDAANQLLVQARTLGYEHRDIASVFEVLTALSGE